MPVEWDIRASDTHLASPIDGSATTIVLAHRRGPAGEGYPNPPVVWLTIAPDDPNEREDIIVTALALSSTSATVVRGVGYSAGLPHRAGTPVRLGTRAGAYPHDKIAPTLGNSWVNVGAPNAPAAYWRTPAGLVVLEGLIKDGTTTTAAFTLPAGWRPHPDGRLVFGVWGPAETLARLDVATNGQVIPQTAPGAQIDLSGVHFWAGG